MLDGTSVISSQDATTAVTAVTGGIKTMVATVLSLTGFFITIYFGNRIIGLIKSSVQG